MRKHRGWLALAGLMVLGGTSIAASGAEPDGRYLYTAYCASCHGAEGHGDGVDADLFLPRPRDLRGGVLAAQDDDALVERIRHGRPLGLARDPEALRARAGDTEILVAHLRRLPTLHWRSIERGQEIYVDRCEICHGPFGHSTSVPSGVTVEPRDLSDPHYQRETSDRVLVDRIQHGHRKMPAIPGLDVPENRDALVAYLRLLSPGYERYSRFCANCHGDDGRGPGVDWASEKRPIVLFDQAYFAKKDPEVLRKDVWHMLEGAEPQMPHMSRVLQASQVRAILAYLRRLPAR
jgi:mono/diheme cytochrome c family protein